MIEARIETDRRVDAVFACIEEPSCYGDFREALMQLMIFLEETFDGPRDTEDGDDQ